jgi:phosphoribosylamine--glycine ligase
VAKRVLVVGKGGREHALAWKLEQSPSRPRVYVAPGNGGTAHINVPISQTDISALVRFAAAEQIDLVIPGSEEPLSLGLVDALRAADIPAVGPSLAASQLESSKAFAKQVMAEAGVPTAAWRVFEDGEAARQYLLGSTFPCVIKADGLAAGKGVFIVQDFREASAAIAACTSPALGGAGRRIVIEEYLQGEEISFFCLCDGRTALPLAAVQDHKRAFDGDTGPNTGGMGTYSPPAFWTAELEEQTMHQVVYPLLDDMARRGTPYQGVLFVGLMITAAGPKVLEFNVRFGDPEAQVLVLRLKSDLYEVLAACAAGRLEEVELQWDPAAAVCVVLAAPGYPGEYPKEIPLEIPALQDYEMVFHAGTVRRGGKLFSSGGRVLNACAVGQDLPAARKRAYQLVQRITFPQAHYRTDIGLRGLEVGLGCTRSGSTWGEPTPTER